ncbi:MAG: T9SS type A sorting domain-containing protein [Saprospiraceae bacterium]|nr:T9SS type A sorting domain-containing protein [Saprospiraceae bacterium]
MNRINPYLNKCIKKDMTRGLLLSLLFHISGFIKAQPPYAGTIFIDPDIVTASDPSALQSTSYTGRGPVTMYDRRIPGWATVNAYLFDVVWNDGLTSVAQVNPEFGTLDLATLEAEKYAYLIGQLPTCLREDVDEIWIHQGNEPFGGGNNSILIHTGLSAEYENSGILEETLVHEASHTSLDATHAATPGWINAQKMDKQFISTYARDNPTTEDIAESYLTWLAVRHRPSSISASDFTKIVQTIPNRLAYFDSIPCNLYPFVQSTRINNPQMPTLIIYPNPVLKHLIIETEQSEPYTFRLYDMLGQDVTHLVSKNGNMLNVALLSSGYYFLRINDHIFKVYKL